MKRYKVATCEGYTISNAVRSGGEHPGLTASVLDTRHCHREVARFRSETRLPTWENKRLGIEGAKRAAQEYADKLNVECGRT